MRKNQKEQTPEDRLFKSAPAKVKRLQQQSKRELRQAAREQWKRENSK